MTTVVETNRGYSFAEHARPSYWPRHDRRHIREDYLAECRSAVEVDGSLPDLTLDAIINRENLLRVFKRYKAFGGPAPGIDGYTYEDFSITEAADILGVISREIHAGRWRPQPARRKRIPKDSGGTRSLSLRCVMDRVVSGAVTEPITARLDHIFLPTSFGSRPGRSVHGLLAEIAYQIEHHGYTVIAQDDIATAFDVVPIGDAVADYAEHIADPGLLRLIETVLRGYDQSRRLGIDQGDPLSPFTLNLRLHNALDLPSSRTTDQGAPLRYRFADNLVHLCCSVSDGHRTIALARALLLEKGFRPKRLANYPVDLRRHNSSTEVLGTTVRMLDGQVRFDLGKKAYSKLVDNLERAHLAPDPALTAVSAIQGWIGQRGMAFESVGVAPLVDRVGEIAARTGLREISRGVLIASADWAQHNWLQTRETVYQRLSQSVPVPGETLLGAPPPSTGP